MLPFFRKAQPKAVLSLIKQQTNRASQSLGYISLVCSFSTTNDSKVTTIKEEFEQKIALGKTLPPLDDNLTKLQMYALFKQAQKGPNNTSKPGMFDFVVSTFL
jgi:hypothetical protein